MKVRIKFSADIYIEGENMKEVKDKFMSMPSLFSKEALKCNAEFNDLELVEDADTYEDLIREYYKA